MAAQLEEAVELYLAADRPRQALAILNQQLSAVMPHAAEEAATGLEATGGSTRGGRGQRGVMRVGMWPARARDALLPLRLQAARCKP